ncbi:hypothetical protein [Yoonia sp. SS1-5]|uniref:Uncharacterized protein n=1 Tax=Yoonia rhodophyticola TaxID=3137370 RepID=A0AAN0MJC8_9RHOB
MAITATPAQGLDPLAHPGVRDIPAFPFSAAFETLDVQTAA